MHFTKIEFYIDEFQLEKTLILSDFIIKDEYITPGLLSMIMEDSKNKTVMTIKSFKPDLGLKDEIFSQLLRRALYHKYESDTI